MTDLEQHVQPAGHEVQRGDFVGFDEPGPGVGITSLRFVDHHDRPTGSQGDEDVRHRHVAFQRRQGQPTVGGADLKVPDEELHRIHHTVVRHLDALGFPG